MTRTAVVGLGGIAAEHLEKLERLEGVEVAGICDLSSTLVDAVAERWGVGPGFTDFAEMLNATEPEVVHVLTPPATHLDLVLAALDAGAHVFVEKPIAPTLGDYRQMRDVARERKLFLVENYNYRFMKVVERGLELVRAGTLGEPVNVAVSMGVGLTGAAYADREVVHFAHSLPGGALRNFASHPASIAVMIVEEWDRVAVSQRRLEPALASDDELRAMVCSERVDASLTLTSHARPARFTFSVQGTDGRLEVDVLDQRLHLEQAEPATARITNGLRQGLGHLGATASLVRRAGSTRQGGYFEGFERLLGGFYAAVAGVSEVPVTIDEMDRTNRLVEQLFDADNQL